MYVVDRGGAMLCCELCMLRSFVTEEDSAEWFVCVLNVADVPAVMFSTLVRSCTVPR